ncbi:hypothetical protein [Klebsiella pneumoniae]|uniref:hypothetical protein n=1 Tax=Klebsiella pneumoniae TaxID=573 RepID=UPI003F67AC0B
MAIHLSVRWKKDRILQFRLVLFSGRRSRLSKESIDLVVNVAGKMLVHLSQAESQRDDGHENDWMADNRQKSCISGLNRHIRKNTPIDAMNYIAFATYHGWPINQQS